MVKRQDSEIFSIAQLYLVITIGVLALAVATQVMDTMADRQW